jgi:hypothetical protein
VSPLWRDEIAIYLAPRRVTLARMKRGVRPQFVRTQDSAVIGERIGGWDAAIGVLGGCLVDPIWNNAACRIIIANHWIRFAIVPWSDALSDGDERLLLAQHCLSKIYGDVVSQWCVTLNEAPPGRPQVACAMPRALLDDIERHTESCGLRIRSIQPQLVAAFNCWRAQLPGAGGWFVTLEEGSLAAAHLSHGAWDTVRAVRTDNNWGVELRRLQTESRLAGKEAERIHLDAPPEFRAVVEGASDEVVWLGEPAGAVDTASPLTLLQRIYA